MTKTARQLTDQLTRSPDLTHVRARVCVQTKARDGFRTPVPRAERLDNDMTSDTTDSADLSYDESDRYHEIDGIARQYTRRDDRRTVLFHGTKLSAVTSDRPNVQRWTEIEIFRTDAGRYIVTRVGMSVIAHEITCTQVASKKKYGIDKLMKDECPPQDREPCPLCRPNISHLLSTSPADLTFEQDKHRTTLWERATDMIDSMYSNQSQRATGGLMLWALEEASKNDPLIAEAYNRAVVIE